MVNLETFTAGGETLTGSFTLHQTSARAVLSTIDPRRGVVVTVNRREITLTRKTINTIVDGDKVEIFF